MVHCENRISARGGGEGILKGTKNSENRSNNF